MREFPEAKLDVMVGPRGEEIFKHYRGISNLIIYDKKINFLKKFRLFVKFRKAKYDFVVDLRNTVFPFVLGAQYKTSPFRYNTNADVIHKKDIHLSRLK